MTRLGLAGTGGDAVRLGTRGGSSAVAAALLRSLLHVQRVGQRSLRHAAQRLAGGAVLLALLLVGSGVERDEKHKVGGQCSNTGESSELLACALASVGHPGPVGRSEVSVRGEVDEAEINDELDDLETGDPLLPPNANATSRLEVVPVHDNVDGEVQGNGNPGDGRGADQLGVAEEGRGTVVVAVKEGCKS